MKPRHRMTSKISNLISQLVQEWEGKNTCKRKELLKLLEVVEEWMMFQHCVEDREAMDEINKEINQTTDPLSEEEWENIIDEQAEEEEELNDAKTKDIPWNRLMPNKEWQFWPKDRNNHE